MHRHAYPETPRGSTVDRLHGQDVEDPYRWLEDLGSQETRSWVRSQNVLARSHLDGLASRPWFVADLTAFVHRRRAGTPDKAGGRYLVARNDGTLEQDQVYVADDLHELGSGGRLLLDPNAFSREGGSSLADMRASRDSELLAYLVSEGGSDWMSLRLVHLDGTTPEEPFEVLTGVRYSTVTWLPDRSFLYTHFDVSGDRGGQDTTVLPSGKLKRHRVGSSQDDDDVVLEFPADAHAGMEPTLSPDGRWLAVAIRRGTAKRNRLWLYPVTTDGDRSVLGEPMKVVDVDIAELAVVRIEGDDLYLRTDHRAPFGKVVRVDLSATATARTVFEDVVPERTSVLRQAVAAGDGILTVHLEDAQPVVTRHSLDGASRAVVPLPGGTVVTLNASAGDDEVFVGMSSVSSPLTSYRVDLGDASVRPVAGLEQRPSEWTAPEVTSERCRARSLDGTEVPYFLFHRSDLALDQTRPTLLYGKGGFKVPALNQFRPAFSSWLAAGGVVAIANLRGGGEYDAAWYETGRGHRKQNVFDDFAAVAEHLVASRCHHLGPARAARRQQRRPHRRSADDAATGARGGVAARGRTHGHAPLPPLHDRRRLGQRVRVTRRSGRLRRPARLLAGPQPPARDVAAGNPGARRRG